VIAAGNSHVWTYTYTIDIPDFTCLPMVLQQSTVPLMQHHQHHQQWSMRVATPSPQWLVCTVPAHVAKGHRFIPSPTVIARATRMYGPIPYTIDIPDFTLPADGASTVNCAADAMLQHHR
jgi:hypothetical protein